MVNGDTQQFLYKAVILTVCLLSGLMLIFLCAVALVEGDGEATRIIDAIQPLFVTALGTMVTTVLGSHVANVLQTQQLANVHIAEAQAGVVSPLSETQPAPTPGAPGAPGSMATAATSSATGSTGVV